MGGAGPGPGCVVKWMSVINMILWIAEGVRN